MIQIDIVKAFLSDEVVQTKYGITPDDMAKLTMNSQHKADAHVFISLVRQMVTLVENPETTVSTAAARLNAHLETILR
ncbi:hypothetical protein JYG30_11495 [Fibrella sp. USSR17]